MATLFSDQMKLALANFERKVGPTMICNSTGRLVPLVIKCDKCDTKMVNSDGTLCGVVHVTCDEPYCSNPVHFYVNCDKRANNFASWSMMCNECAEYRMTHDFEN